MVTAWERLSCVSGSGAKHRRPSGYDMRVEFDVCVSDLAARQEENPTEQLARDDADQSGPRRLQLMKAKTAGGGPLQTRVQADEIRDAIVNISAESNELSKASNT